MLFNINYKKLFSIVGIILLVFSCGKHEVSIVVKNYSSGNLQIDGKPYNDFILKSHSTSNTDSLFFLDLLPGRHKFRYFLGDSTIIDTSCIIQGETYLFIDMQSGELGGF
ncbi:hypothetical protein HQ585_17595 [candidate division KSB1 bacterium]|nr:hypothetical protein [candidate division KSB1 bacterium]